MELPGIYYGSFTPSAPARILHAGSLTCLYQAGAIRKVRAGKTEILRMIYPAIRDPDWGTVPGIITGEKIEEHEDSFSILYDCRYSEGGIEYLSTVWIVGTKYNSLIFSMKGKALSSFHKNRLGLNILHPIKECSGRMCKVTTPEGKQYNAEFPVDISPHQPMKDIQCLEWALECGIHAFLQLFGEIFEMEDQRNWTDASYKTYCTPLDLPFPVSIEKGENLYQEVKLNVKIQDIQGVTSDENRVILPEEKTMTPFPALGICKSSETGPLEKNDLALINETGFMHYRVDLHLYQQGWEEIISEGVREAASMGLALEIGLFFDVDSLNLLNELVRLLKNYACLIVRFLVFTSDHLIDEGFSATVIQILKMKFPGTFVGAGTNANFAELNRNRPDPDLPDFLTYSINPQVHVADPLSMVENLAGQKDTVLTAKSFPGNKPISISPVTLKSRFYIDPRQPSLFCAGWTLGSFKYLAEAGVVSITYYETAGRGGIIHGDHQPLSPDDFMAVKGDIYPVYFLLRGLLRFRDYQISITKSSHPLRFSCTLLEDNTQQILILANHTATVQEIHLPEGMQWQAFWLLDENTLSDLRSGKESWQNPVDPSYFPLNPLGIAFLKLI